MQDATYFGSVSVMTDFYLTLTSPTLTPPYFFGDERLPRRKTGTPNLTRDALTTFLLNPHSRARTASGAVPRRVLLRSGPTVVCLQAAVGVDRKPSALGPDGWQSNVDCHSDCPVRRGAHEGNLDRKFNFPHSK